jgi:SAM-dependent methyltransferase
MQSPLSRFDRTARDYRRFRPSYPAALVDWIRARGRLEAGARILDAGCGTGITSRLFAAHGYRVVGVDPSVEMLAAARADGGAQYVRARAEATGLRAQSCALAVSGQAFHWFDLRRATVELDRVVRPGGLVAAFWNSRAPGPFEDGYHALLLRHSSEYGALGKGPDTLARLRVLLAGRALHETLLENHQDLAWEELLGRARSSSYVAHGVADREGFARELLVLFEAHATDGRVRLRYELRALAWDVERSD